MLKICRVFTQCTIHYLLRLMFLEIYNLFLSRWGKRPTNGFYTTKTCPDAVILTQDGETRGGPPTWLQHCEADHPDHTPQWPADQGISGTCKLRCSVPPFRMQNQSQKTLGRQPIRHTTWSFGRSLGPRYSSPG